MVFGNACKTRHLYPVGFSSIPLLVKTLIFWSASIVYIYYYLVIQFLVLNIIKDKFSETTTNDIYINRESRYYVYFINSYVLVKQMYNFVYIKSAVHCLD